MQVESLDISVFRQSLIPFFFLSGFWEQLVLTWSIKRPKYNDLTLYLPHRDEGMERQSGQSSYSAEDCWVGQGTYRNSQVKRHEFLAADLDWIQDLIKTSWDRSFTTEFQAQQRSGMIAADEIPFLGKTKWRLTPWRRDTRSFDYS